MKVCTPCIALCPSPVPEDRDNTKASLSTGLDVVGPVLHSFTQQFCTFYSKSAKKTKNKQKKPSTYQGTGGSYL
jgi:hypothetical protein